MTINEILSKVLDNASLGKAVTDVGPGFALSVPLLMIFSLLGNFSVIPADRLNEIIPKEKAAASQLRQAKLYFCTLLAQHTDSCTQADSKEEAQQEARANEGYIKGRRRIAQLGVEAEAYRERQQSAAKGLKQIPQDAPGLDSVGQYEVFTAQKELVDEAAAELDKYTNQKNDAESLEFNIAGLTQNISAIIAFSVVLGVLLSQITHLLLVDLLFSSFGAAKRLLATSISPEQVLSKEDDELVKNYYRYTEGAINMILPVLLLSIVFPLYVTSRLEMSVSTVASVAAGMVVSVLLGAVGYRTYISFLKKRVDLATAAKGSPGLLTPRTK